MSLFTMLVVLLCSCASVATLSDHEHRANPHYMSSLGSRRVREEFKRPS